MDSFYSDLGLKELFVPKEQYPAPSSVHQPFLSGIYHDEESVDFSAIVAACENPSPNFYAPGSCASSSSGGPTTAEYYDPQEPSFTFDMPEIYCNDTGGYPTSSQMEYTSPLVPKVIDPLAGTDPSPGKAPRTPRATTKKKVAKDSEEYREKRNRNNVAVRKSRNKSKIKVMETEKRVKELEEENGHLQNKIALLTKELNVLKSLFNSAGVDPPVKLEGLE